MNVWIYRNWHQVCGGSSGASIVKKEICKIRDRTQAASEPIIIINIYLCWSAV
jgi:hypothetical protein